MKFTGIYSICVGALMLIQWGFFALTGQIPELQTEPIRIGLHLTGEGFTALALILSGIGLLGRKSWARTASVFSHGLLTYTVIVSPGYFAQQRSWPVVVMFLLLFVLTLISLRLLVHKDNIIEGQ